MGVLRFLFALSVLLFHAGSKTSYTIINNQVAVCSFFVISGFYMALILEKKYAGKYMLFWTNRFLRIFPLYWITLLVTFLFVLLKFFLHIGTEDNAIVHYIQFAPHTSGVVFILSLINYIVRNITLILTSDYFLPNDNTPGMLLVQQAWTLQIELLFYLIAPFIMRLSLRKILLATILYVLLFWGIFVPFHLLSSRTLIFIFLQYFIFFLGGVLSFKLLYERVRKNILPKKISFTILIGFLSAILLYGLLPNTYSVFALKLNDAIYFILLTLCIPFIFQITSLSAIDLFIGELSYPLYITHFFVVKMFANMWLVNQGWYFLLAIVLVSLLAAWLTTMLIERPIDALRQKRIKSSVNKKKKV